MVRMPKRRAGLYGLLVLTLVLVSCGGGGGGGGGVALVPVSALQGTWYGTIEDLNLDLYTFKVTVNANGTVTNELQNGSTTGVSHTITTVAGHPRIFSMAGSDGSSGGFYVDSSLSHAVFVDDNENVGVLELGATSHPTYDESYAIGSWKGMEVELNASYDLVDTSGSSVTVLADGSFSGSNKWDSFSGTFLGGTIDTSLGRFTGTLSAPVAGIVTVFVTPDAAFAGGYACPNSFYWPEDCTFSAWSRQ